MEKMFGGIDMASNLIQTNQIANIQTSKKLVLLSINGSIKTTILLGFSIDINHLYLKNLSEKWFITVDFK